MTPEETFDSQRPSDEELAAYIDGELERSRSEAVEAWLAAHPDSCAEVDSLRRLMRLYQETQPTEPAGPTWAAVLEGIHGGIDAPRPTALPRSRSTRPVRLVLAMASAAALLAFWLLARSWWVPSLSVEDSDEEPYPVASAEEVTVISMETADAGGLVVGQPPIGDNYEFASPADVTVVKLEGVPQDRRPPEMLHGEVPMLFAPDVVSGRQD